MVINGLERIVIATNNPSKINKFTKIFTGITNTVLSLHDLGITSKPEETGKTAEENAEIKARFYSSITNLPTFSEDEALYADFLSKDQQPGVYVRRINGKDESSDENLLSYWEEIIRKVPINKRTGHWHTAYSIAVPNLGIKTTALDHFILFHSPSSKIRLPGWPLSSLEGSILIGKPHSEFTDKENDIVAKETSRIIRLKIAELLQVKL